MADQTVSMISPDGKDVADVPVGQVEHFKSLGAKVVEPPPPMSLGRRLAKGALDSLPGIGAVVGGVISTPETGGAATIPGIALGAGAGRGIRDLIGHYSGLDEPTTAMQKAGHIVGDTAMTGATAAILPGAVAALRTPIQTLREASEHFGSSLPAGIQRLGKLLPSLPTPPAKVPEFPGMTAWGEPITPVQGGLSAADKAMLARQNYSPAHIQQVEQELLKSRSAPPAGPSPSAPRKWPITPQVSPESRIVPETGETQAAWRARVAANILNDGSSAGGSTPAQSTGTSFQPAPMPQRPPMTVSPSSPMQPPVTGKAATLADTGGASDQLGSLLDAIHGPNAPANGNGLLKAPSPIRSIEGRPAPLYPSAGTVKGVTSNALEAASNQALAAGHWDEAERLIGQSLQSFFQGSGGPMAGILAAAIAHKARQVVEPLRADPSFQQATPAKQQQMIQQALRQPGARGSLTSLLGS